MNGNDYWEVVLVIRWHLTEYSLGTPVPKYLRYDEKKNNKQTNKPKKQNFPQMSSFFIFRVKILFRDILFRLGRRIVEVEIQTFKNRIE